MSKAHVTIDLNDVVSAGSVDAAIEEWCASSDTTSCGVVGSGWTQEHDSSDYASRALHEGAMHYIDLDDGRMMSSEYVDDDTDDEDVLRDMGGCTYREGDWSDESVVCIECPNVDDAVEHPTELAAMATAVLQTHRSCSDVLAWCRLVTAIRHTAEVLDGVAAEYADLLDDLESAS